MRNLHASANILHPAIDRSDLAVNYTTLNKYESGQWEEIKVERASGRVVVEFWYSFYEEIAHFREGDVSLVTE